MTRRWSGAGLLWVGAVLLLSGLGVNALLDGDSPLWWLHDTDSLGRLVPVAGSFLVGAALVRRRSVPFLVAGALPVAAVVSLPFNAQDDRVLLNLPLGLAWAAVGSWWWLQWRRTATAAGAVPSTWAPRSDGGRP